MKCAGRYVIGAHIFFLVCRRDEGHPGPHWDEAIGLLWTGDADENPDVYIEPTRSTVQDHTNGSQA